MINIIVLLVITTYSAQFQGSAVSLLYLPHILTYILYNVFLYFYSKAAPSIPFLFLPFLSLFSIPTCIPSPALPYSCPHSVPYWPAPSHWMSLALVCTTLPDRCKLPYSSHFSLHQECLKRRGQRHAHLLPRSGPWRCSWHLWILIQLVLLGASWRGLGEPDRLLELYGRYSIR